MNGLLLLAIGCGLAQTPLADDVAPGAQSQPSSAPAAAVSLAAQPEHHLVVAQAAPSPEEHSAWAFLLSPFALGLAGSLVWMAVPLALVSLPAYTEWSSYGLSAAIFTSPLVVAGVAAAGAFGLFGAVLPHLVVSLSAGHNPLKVAQRAAPALAIAVIGTSLLAISQRNGSNVLSNLSSGVSALLPNPYAMYLVLPLAVAGAATAAAFLLGAPLAGPIGALLVTPLQEEWL